MRSTSVIEKLLIELYRIEIASVQYDQEIDRLLIELYRIEISIIRIELRTSHSFNRTL